jgi:hypothetical protein
MELQRPDPTDLAFCVWGVRGTILQATFGEGTPMTHAPPRYPAHYPPTERWKTFFLGVRWLGPDLSFFPVLQAQQAARAASLMNVWDGGRRRRIATVVGEIFGRHLGWSSTVFLPQDHLTVIAGGPRFSSFDEGGDAIAAALGAIEAIYGITLPPAFWRNPNRTLADLVECIASRDPPTTT